jgi:hypothetical protein
MLGRRMESDRKSKRIGPLLFESKKMLSDQDLHNNLITEYNALREEILFRLRVQQDMINYSLLFVGFVATILTIQDLDIGAILIVLLFGPLVGIFLALIYLKQHILSRFWQDTFPPSVMKHQLRKSCHLN